MGHIIGKIVQTVGGPGNSVELIIGEHSGAFNSTGVIKLVADSTAAFDLYKALGQRVTWKGGPLAPKMGRNFFNGKRIMISFG